MFFGEMVSLTIGNRYGLLGRQKKLLDWLAQYFSITRSEKDDVISMSDNW